MFEQRRARTQGWAALHILELVYHATVYNIRKTHRNALVGLIVNMAQIAMLVVVFYVMFTIMGIRGLAIRGDFLVYIMSGVFLFIAHIKSVTAVSSAEGPTSPIMLHAPMNTLVAILGAALSSLYIQVLTMVIVLPGYYAVINAFEIYKPIPTFGMLLLAWFTGAAVGVLLMAVSPWAPGLVSFIRQLYNRANMMASGKMFVANQLPPSMVALFDWNPLFHTIDQARGFAFINYNPRNSSVEYAFYLGVAILMIGLMLEFYTRRQASTSWSAGK